MLKLRVILLMAVITLSGCAEDKPSNQPPETSDACKSFQREADSMQESGKTMKNSEWNAWVKDFHARMKETLPQGETCIISGDGKRY